MRSAFHGVLVDQLGIETAWYLGHSLGGQFVLGYALKYPEAVKGLVLEAPAGLEQFPKTMLIGDVELPVFDPAIGRDFEAWQAAWDPTGAFESEFNRTEQGVRDFFHFIERDPVTGAAMPEPLRLLQERHRICPAPHRSARRDDHRQSGGVRAVGDRVHLRHLHHRHGTQRRRSRRASTTG